MIEHASGGKPGYIRTHSPNQVSFSSLIDKGTPYLFISSDGKNVVRDKMADTTVVSKDSTSQTMTPENYGDLTDGLLESSEDGEGGQ
ncbi:MAG: hypothetical protein LUE98_04575 [Tannerellaceae bacterium]|nr:hypothetical protein [Tannerellaceae bacterium]